MHSISTLSSPAFGSRFTKVAWLWSSVAKRNTAPQTIAYIQSVIQKDQQKIFQKFGLDKVPDAFIVVTGAHSSRTDTRPHYTVDLYRKARPELGIMTDQPIGVVHVYKEDDTEKEEDCTVFENPRTKAKASYDRALGITSNPAKGRGPGAQS